MALVKTVMEEVVAAVQGQVNSIMSALIFRRHLESQEQQLCNFQFFVQLDGALFPGTLRNLLVNHVHLEHSIPL